MQANKNIIHKIHPCNSPSPRYQENKQGNVGNGLN